MTPNSQVILALLLVCFPNTQKATPTRFLIETKDSGAEANSDYAHACVPGGSNPTIEGKDNTDNTLIDRRTCSINFGDDYQGIFGSGNNGNGVHGGTIAGNLNDGNKVIGGTIAGNDNNGNFVSDDYNGIYGVGNDRNRVHGASIVGENNDGNVVTNDYNILGSHNNGNGVHRGTIAGSFNDGNKVVGGTIAGINNDGNVVSG